MLTLLLNILLLLTDKNKCNYSDFIKFLGAMY